jgi:hypothetical protein
MRIKHSTLIAADPHRMLNPSGSVFDYFSSNPNVALHGSAHIAAGRRWGRMAPARADALAQTPLPAISGAIPSSSREHAA